MALTRLSAPPTEPIEPTEKDRDGITLGSAEDRLSRMAKRSFSPSGTPEKSADYHGACRYVRTSPDVVQKGVKSLNIEMQLEEALKLRLALDSCLLSLNRYNRSTLKGRAMGVVLSIKTESSSIAVIEVAMRPQDSAD